jgi:hypothetical protein
MMKNWITVVVVSLLGGSAYIITLAKTYALPYAIGKLHEQLEHENQDDRALMVALLTWVRRRGSSFGLTSYTMTNIEEKALSGLPDATRKALEDLTHEAVVRAAKEIGG